MSKGAAQRSSAQPSTGQPGTSHATASQHGAAQPSTGRPGIGQPGAAQPSADVSGQPLLTVARGEPTAAEFAAIAVVVGALASRASERATAGQLRASVWAARDRAMRPQLHPGPGAWKASALPR
jgi:hypothetical protein